MFSFYRFGPRAERTEDLEDERPNVSSLSTSLDNVKPDFLPTDRFYWMSDALAGGSWSTGASLM